MQKGGLFQRNEYKKPHLFHESIFDTDVEGQNFYLLDNAHPSKKALSVHASSKTRFNGFSSKRTMSTSDKHESLNFLARLANSVLIGGTSYMFYNRYSQIVYEGDSLNVFGLFTYNLYSDEWELSKPIGFIKDGSVKEFMTSLTWEQFYLSCGIAARSILVVGCVLGTFWAARRLFRRLRNSVLRMIRNRYREADQAQQIPDAPPFEREGVDKIDIESYSCATCKHEARNIIFLPCKDCYLCKECYSQLDNESKNKCGRCQKPIQKIIQIYASGQQHE